MKTEIVRLDDFGDGICYLEGKITFVPKTVIGDIIEVEVIDSKKNYNRGICKKIIEKSSKREEPKCPYFNICGGCSLQNISYEDSCQYKANKVKEAFKRNGFLVNPEFVSNPNPYNYRNKVTLKVINGAVGYYESSSHKLVEISNCMIVKECINKVIPLVSSWNILNGEVVIRCNQNDEILIVIKTEDEISINVNELKKNIKLCGVLVNERLIYGESFLIEKINNLFYKISYDSFFQVNPFVAGKLFELVGKNINSNDIVLELYSGVGTLSLSAALNALTVTGVEIIPNAVLNSKYNASLNRISNVEFLLNDATDAVRKIKMDFNKLIVDPPRMGLSRDVIEMILTKLPQEIIYVSCDMSTLIRDLKFLKEKFRIKKMYSFDMFSYTYHIENMVILEKI